MNRRKFIQVSSAGATVAAVTQSVSAQDNENDKPGALAMGHPAVMAPRTDGAEIIWRVSSLAKGYVEYGKTDKLGEVARDDGWGLRPAGDEVIRVRLDGLEPGTTYHYRVVTENFDHKKPHIEKGKLRTFKTLSSTASTTTFSVWNDTHKHNATIAKLTELTPASDFLIWNGDTSNDWYRKNEIASTLVTPGDGADITSKAPLFIVRGNHDVRGTLAYQVEDVVATPDGNPWFAFRSGPVAAICLDTGEDKPDDHPYLFGRAACEPMRREQAAWLEKIIKHPDFKDAPYRIAFCHIPLRWIDEKTKHSYDHFSKRSRDLWHDSLVRWRTQAIISGHTHRDAYIPANKDFPYAQLVGGGPKMNQARVITGAATKEKLELSLTDMSGKKTRSQTFNPLT